MKAEEILEKAAADEEMTVEEIMQYREIVKPKVQTYGKYGTLAKEYLEKHNPAKLWGLAGDLSDYLHNIDKQADDLYTMSRYRFKSRKQMMKATLILNIFPNFMNMTALFVLMTQFQLINNLWGLILLYSSGATMGFLVQKGFFDTIPGTIYDAATLDGANDLRVFISITIPLAKPMIVYTALTAFVWPWADFMLPSMLLIDKSSWTVAVGLNKLNESEFSIFAAGAIFVAVPIVALYIALSKYLIQGGAAGAVKE